MRTAIYAGVPAANTAFAEAAKVTAALARGRCQAEMNSFRNGLQVLRRFTTQHPECGSAELARAIGKDRVVMWRMLRTCVARIS